MSKAYKILGKSLQILVPVLILAGGVGAFAALAGQKKDSKRVIEEEPATAVAAITAQASDHPIEVDGQGWVIPAREMVVQPEVVGRVMWQHPQLVAGGRVQAGDTLVRLDGRAYQLVARTEKARVDRARLDLEIEQSRKRVAEAEWKLFHQGDAPSKKNPLALREPQLRTAKVALEAAESGHERARLDVRRTLIKAPFDAMITREAAELGQLVSPQSQLATLIGTDNFLVEVSIHIEHLARIAVPGLGAESGQGSLATIRQDIAGRDAKWTGRVVRALGTLDQNGGMARVLVEVADPLRVESGAAAAPLLVGAFVHVSIAAGQLEDSIELPRTAVREDRQVYVIENGVLKERPVDIAWRTRDHVLVTGGLVAGDQVITSRLANPVPGMAVELVAGSSQPEAKSAASTDTRDAGERNDHARE